MAEYVVSEYLNRLAADPSGPPGRTRGGVQEPPPRPAQDPNPGTSDLPGMTQGHTGPEDFPDTYFGSTGQVGPAS